jgi:PAS domain S-box-containing protein
MSEGQSTFEAADAPLALLDEEGTVVGWSRAAQRLVGYSAAEVVGQCLSVLLMAAADRVEPSGPGDQNTLGGRGYDHAQVRHRDGHSIEVSLCVSSLSGRDGLSSWLVWATNQAVLPPRAAEGTGAVSLPGALPLPSRPPVSVVIGDTRLRCIWVNDIQVSKDGIPLPRRLGRPLTEAVPGAEAETSRR